MKLPLEPHIALVRFRSLRGESWRTNSPAALTDFLSYRRTSLTPCPAEAMINAPPIRFEGMAPSQMREQPKHPSGLSRSRVPPVPNRLAQSLPRPHARPDALRPIQFNLVAKPVTPCPRMQRQPDIFGKIDAMGDPGARTGDAARYQPQQLCSPLTLPGDRPTGFSTLVPFRLGINVFRPAARPSTQRLLAFTVA